MLPIYEGDQLDQQNVLFRSRLYHLQPIGIGTPYVECLTSYISRLAEAHNVSIKTLVLQEILSKFPNVYASRPSLIKSFWLYSAALNGTSASSNDWIQALASLTLRTDLNVLTMLTWQHILTPRMLLRRTLAWCSHCYTEWEQVGSAIYIPLLWVLQAVTVCVRHQQRLQSQCPNPNCRSQLPYLFTSAHPGYCCKCQGWLGSASFEVQADTHTVSSAELEWQWWVHQALGDLLSVTVEASVRPKVERVTVVISEYVEQVTNGNVRALAHQLGLSNRGLRDVQLGRRVLQLDTLLQICYRLGITPRQFLIGDSVPMSARLPSSILPEFRRISRRTYKTFHLAEVQRQLEEIVANNEVPPPSMAAVARRVGHDQSNLTERFPELTHSITTRYRAFRRKHREAWLQQMSDEIRQVILALCQQGIYPTYKQIRGCLSDPNFLRLPEARAVRRVVLAELGLSY